MWVFWRSVLLLALTATWLVGCRPAAEDGTRLRVALMPRLTHAPAVTGLQSGRFAAALPGTTVVPRAFDVGNAVMEALYAGEIDVAYLGPSPAINGFVRSGGSELRVVAGAATGGSLLVVRSGAGIERPRDLSGKRCATLQIGSSQDIALRTYLRRHGLGAKEEGGTVTVLPLSGPILRSAFDQAEIDAAWVSEPLASILIHHHAGQPFAEEKEIWPDGKYLTTLVVVRKRYLDAHPEVVRRFVAAHLAEVNWIEGHRAEALELTLGGIGRLGGAVPPAEIAATAWKRLEVTADPMPEALARSAREAQLSRLLPPESRLDELVDPDPLAAARRAAALADVGSSTP